MKQGEANQLLDGFKRPFAQERITALGRSTGFKKRERKMTPLKRVMSLRSCIAGAQRTTLADIQRSDNALSVDSIAYKPLHNQLAKRSCGHFMREVATPVLSALVVEGLKPGPAGQLSEFGRVLIQDGSSLAVHSGLRREYPGRFTAVSPAAVELHVTWDLCREQIEQV